MCHLTETHTQGETIYTHSLEFMYENFHPCPYLLFIQSFIDNIMDSWLFMLFFDLESFIISI